MTREGMKAAARHSRKLLQFDSLREAETALRALRDEALRALEAASTEWAFSPDYTPESLKLLEQEFFRLHEVSFAGAPIAREVMGRAMAMYFGEVLVRCAGFGWRVEEFAFDRGKYEIGVARGLMAIMLSSFEDVPARPNNKLRQSMWREYKRYAS